MRWQPSPGTLSSAGVSHYLADVFSVLSRLNDMVIIIHKMLNCMAIWAKKFEVGQFIISSISIFMMHKQYCRHIQTATLALSKMSSSSE